MKEAYAVRRTVPPSAEIEEQIENLLAVGVGENPRESLSELARLGARLIIQRAVEDEFDAIGWLAGARAEPLAISAERASSSEAISRLNSRTRPSMDWTSCSIVGMAGIVRIAAGRYG